mmetsp:Transcript_30560/g.51172  ORF Transcript_30560/g.51172 Transcript_30560/m.51172 type:complete len:233 (+) Transcript_30560:38-736(+)
MLCLSSFIMLVFLLVVSLLFVSSLKDNSEPVTYGSVIKLQHKDTGNNLHSHGIAWGSGSGQQSITTNSAKSDKGSLWIVKESSKDLVSEIGTPIKCGAIVRFEHADSHKNLHSHLFQSPLSGNQEVSGFGDNGNGDTGDNWQVQCDIKSDELWFRYKGIYLRHMDTSKFLSTSAQAVFNQQNCGGNCPIMGQTEVHASSKKSTNGRWATDQGVYFPSKEAGNKEAEEEDDEL